MSYYHFHTGLNTWQGSLDEFVDDFINSNIMYSPYWPMLLDFWQMRNEPTIFFTTYEAMQLDLANVIRKLNAFLQLPDIDDSAVEQLIQHLSFDKMKGCCLN